MPLEDGIVAASKQDKSYRQNLATLPSYSQNASLHHCKEINTCWLSPPVCGTLLWDSWLRQQTAGTVFSTIILRSKSGEALERDPVKPSGPY